jgi:hypothetical protein
VGLFDSAKKLLKGETISFETTTHTNAASSLLRGNRQAYVGQWRGAVATLDIKRDGTVEYRREVTVGDTTNTDSVAGPIDSFDGPSFVVGILRHTTRFDVDAPPAQGDDGRMTMTVNGDRLDRAEPAPADRGR